MTTTSFVAQPLASADIATGQPALDAPLIPSPAPKRKPSVVAKLVIAPRSATSGAIGPEPHPNFIEVFYKAPLGDSQGTVAGAGEDAP